MQDYLACEIDQAVNNAIYTLQDFMTQTS